MKQIPFKNTFFLSALLACFLLLVFWQLYQNVSMNLARQSITTGFDYLSHEAAFEIGESPIHYSAADSYARALFVGFLNTLKAGMAGIAVSLLLGIAVGIARLSTHRLLSLCAACYVEILRNVPALLQLFFWYSMLNAMLPSPRRALNPFIGVFLSNRGIMFPSPELHLAHPERFVLGIGVTLVLIFITKQWKTSFKCRDYGALVPLLLAACWFIGEGNFNWSLPRLAGFNFKGGLNLSLEFTALVLGLGVYTSAFVAEAVRAGIRSVGRDQWEAGKALGLSSPAVFRKIVFPQALRVIIPPVTGLMLGLVKNSSLAVAIGYPDFLSVSNTAINQTGQVIEGVLLIMGVYLSLSLATSFAMKKYDAHISKGWRLP